MKHSNIIFPALMFLSLNLMAGDPPTPKPPPALTDKQIALNKEYDVVDKTVNTLLDDPLYQHIYDQVQGSFLRTNTDLTISNFFDSNPFIQAIRPSLQKEMQDELRVEIQKSHFSMVRLTDNDPNPVHQELLQAARQSLTDAGTPASEVANAKFFLALGDINAYTPTGKEGEHVIVLQSELLEKFLYMDDEVIGTNGKTIKRAHIISSVILSIFRHEYRHNKSNHVSIGVENTAFLMQCLKYFANPKSLELPEDGIRSKLGQFLTRFMGVFNFKSQKVSEDEIRTKLTHNVGGMWMQSDLNKYLGKTARGVQQKLEANKPGDQMRVELLAYLETIIRAIVQDGEMDPDVLRFLVSLRTAPPGSVDGKAMVEALSKVQNFVSRSFEASADSGITDKSTLADGVAPMVKFAGANFPVSPFDPNWYPNIEYQVMLHIEENDNLYKNASYETQYMLLGNSSGNHPFPSQRQEYLYRIYQTLDVSITQNRLAMLMVTADAMVHGAKNGEINKTLIKNQIAKLKAGQATDDVNSQITRLEKLYTLVDGQIKSMGALTDKVSNIVVSLATQKGMEGDLTSNRFLTDLLDIQLGRKIRNLGTQERVQNALNETKDPAEKSLLTDLMATYKGQFTDGDVIFGKIRDQIKGKNVYSEKLDLALDPNLTSEKAREARTEIDTILGKEDPGFFYRLRARSPVNNEMDDIKQPSIKAYHLPPDMLAARQNDLEKIVRGEGKERSLNPDTLPTSITSTRSLRSAYLDRCRLDLAALRRPFSPSN